MYSYKCLMHNLLHICNNLLRLSQKTKSINAGTKPHKSSALQTTFNSYCLFSNDSQFVYNKAILLLSYYFQ